MAVSPLAQIDWNNLEGADANTVMNLLQRAFNERLVVARVNLGVTVNTSRFFPFPDDNPTNSAFWGNTASLWRWTTWGGVNTPVMDDLCRHYADMTYINANINTVIPVLGNFIDEDNINLTPTKVFNYIGITEWPRVRNPNKTALRQWYDILLLFTHVFMVENDSGVQDQVGGDHISYEFSGLYDTGFSTPSDRLYFESGTPDLADLATDWALLYSGPVAKTVYLSGSPINNTYVQAERNSTNYDMIALRLYTTINNQDLTDTGYTRVPLETKCWGQWGVSIDSSTSNRDPVATAAYLATNNIVDLELIDFGGASVRSAAEIEYTSTDSPYTLPSFDDKISFSTQKAMKFFDNWNDPTGATGFQFYTP